MNKFLSKKIESFIPLNQNLNNGNDFNEIEIRFSEIDNSQRNLSKENFLKIYNFYKTQKKQENEIIVDYIFKKNINNDFFEDSSKNSKYMKKYTYKNQYDDYNEYFNILDFNPNNNNTYNKLEYIKKEKKNESDKDYIRITHSLETNKTQFILNNKNSNLIHHTNKPFDIVRLKNRYIFDLDDNFKLDMTIVKTYTAIQMKEKNYDTEYIVELELKSINDYENLKMNMKKNVNNIVGNYFNKKDYLFNLKTMNPYTFSKKDLIFLKKHKYTVTDKADGERTFIIFYENDIILINPKTKEILQSYKNKTGLNGTIIDGEYLKESNEFLAFDILFYGSPNKNYKDVREYNLTKRLEFLERVVDFYIKKQELDIKIKLKKFYYDIFNDSKYIWENKEKLFEYSLDGLIYTPVEQSYTSSLSDTVLPVFKWKEKLSIDVRIQYNHRERFTYFHYFNDKGKEWNERSIRYINKNLYKDLLNKKINFGPWTTSDKNIIENLKEFNIGNIKKSKTGKKILHLGLQGFPNSNSEIQNINNKYDIIEYEYDFKINSWVALRLRTFDKDEPNKYMTIKSIVEVILNYVSLNDIYDLKDMNIENIGLLYDFTKDNIKRKNWRIFNNYVKLKLYEKANTLTNINYHLELACGKGGDIQKLEKNGYKNILAIDTSSNELYGKNGYKDRLLKMGYIKENYYYKKGDIKFTLVNGDVSKSIKNFECGLNEEENKKIKLFYDDLPENWNGFDTISIMFAIHYLFGDFSEDNKPWNISKNKFEGFIENIKLLKKGGVFFGTYLNGYNITEDKMEFYHNGDMIYKIEHLLNKEIKTDSYDNIWKNKEINTILIENEVWGKNIQIPEPKINKDILDLVLNHHEFKSVLINNSFEQFYEDFKNEKKLNLSINEQKLTFINNIFIYTSFNIEEFINNINNELKINIFNLDKLKMELKNNIINNNYKLKDMKIIYNNLFLNN